jgi:uncharacterized membrane protein
MKPTHLFQAVALTAWALATVAQADMTDDEIKEKTTNLKIVQDLTSVISFDVDNNGFIDDNVSLSAATADSEAYDAAMQSCLSTPSCAANIP